MSLIKLHYREFVPSPSPGDSQNERYLLQAAFLLQDMTAGSQGDENRQLLLISIRLHTLLGLPNVALGLIADVRIKEFLYDTVGYTWLSRISLTYPLGSPKRSTTDPSSNLAAAIQFFGKASRNINDFLKADIQGFQFDQALELVDFKRKLDLSLVKHLSVLERRRIARLKGVACDEVDLDFIGKSTCSLSR
jgi:N-terminal acetyltransferase B complex non-catalytic subunit